MANITLKTSKAVLIGAGIVAVTAIVTYHLTKEKTSNFSWKKLFNFGDFFSDTFNSEASNVDPDKEYLVELKARTFVSLLSPDGFSRLNSGEVKKGEQIDTLDSFRRGEIVGTITVPTNQKPSNVLDYGYGTDYIKVTTLDGKQYGYAMKKYFKINRVYPKI